MKPGIFSYFALSIYFFTFITNCGFTQVIRQPTNRYPGVIVYGDFSNFSEVVEIANKLCKKQNKKTLIKTHKLYSIRDILAREYYPWSRGKITRLIRYQITFSCGDY